MPVVRWSGKRTSGRYVYRGQSSGLWWWQCDLHEDEFHHGQESTMAAAFSAALQHATICPFTNDPPEVQK